MKDLFLLNNNITYLNHGSYGACPTQVFENYQNWQRKLEEQPVQFMTKIIWENLKTSRDTLGKFLGCSGEDLVLFPNPTTAVNNIIENLNLSQNDEVLMTQHEYGALVRAWLRSSKKNNFLIIQQHIDLPLHSKNMFVNQFLSGVTKNTKVIFISQITSQTGLIFPVKEVCDYARQKGIITIIDGAHVPGHIDLNVSDLSCDYYTGACHKWMCAPKGSSFLFVKKSLQADLRPQIMSWGEEGEDPGPSQFLMDFQWQGTKDMSAFLSIPSAINFLEDDDWKEKRKVSKNLILEVSNNLIDIFDTESLFLNKDWIGQMVSHPLPPNMTPDLKEKLWEEYMIEVPIFEWNNQKFIRVSAHFYNRASDMEILISALKSIYLK